MSLSDEAIDEAFAEVVARRELWAETYVPPVDNFKLTLLGGV